MTVLMRTRWNGGAEYRFSFDDYADAAPACSDDAVALVGDPSGNAEVGDGLSKGGSIPNATGFAAPSRRT